MSAAEVVQLARGVIRDHFGPVAEEVIKVLLEAGPQTFAELGKRLAAYNEDTLRNSLTTLIQHSIVAYTSVVQHHRRKTPALQTSHQSEPTNCVNNEEGDNEEEEEEEEEDVFSTAPEAIIRRLQYPHYLSMASSALGEYAGIVVGVALENGISSANKIVSMVCERCATRAGQDPRTYSERDFERDTARARAAVNALVDGHFLVRVLQNSELTRPPAQKRSSAGGLVAVPRFALAGSTEIPPSKSPVLADYQKRASAAAAASRSKSTANVDFFEDTISSEALPCGNGDDEHLIEPGSLWRVNFAQFVEYQRMLDVYEYVASKSGGFGAEVVKLLLRLSGGTDRPVEFDRIAAAAAKASACTLLSVEENENEKILARLKEMVRAGVLNQRDENSFGVNMSGIITAIKMNKVGNVIDEKFGPKALRVFNVILQRRTVVENQLCELAMIKKAEVATALDLLSKTGFLSLKIVHCAVGSTLRLWSVSVASVQEVGERELVKAIQGLRRTAAEDIENGRALIRKAQNEEEVRESNCSSSADNGNTLTPDERVALDKLLAKQERLEQTIIRLTCMSVALREYQN